MGTLRLFDLLHQLKQFPAKNDALAAKENGKWRTYSTEEYIDTVNYVSYAFINMGIQPGDRIGLISNNRPEWNFIDLAIFRNLNLHIFYNRSNGSYFDICIVVIIYSNHR